MERPTTAYDLATLRAVRAEAQRRAERWRSFWNQTDEAELLKLDRFRELHELITWIDEQIEVVETAVEDHLDDRYVLTACGQASMST